MGIMDSLSGLFSGGGGNTQAPMDKDKLSALLAAISSGNGGGSTDYAALMDAYNPAPKKTNILSDLGDSLVQTSAKNPLSDDFGTLGLALADMNSKKKLADEKYQEQGKKSISDLMGVATNQRTFGLDSKKHADKTEHDKATLAETLRNNIENNKYHNAMAAVARGNLGVAQSNAENGKYGNVVKGSDGKYYSLDSKTGNFLALKTPDGVTFADPKDKKGVDIEKITEGITTVVGASDDYPLDKKTLGEMVLEVSKDVEENGDMGGAIARSVQKRGGLKNFTEDYNLFTPNKVRLDSPPAAAPTSKKKVDVDAVIKKARAGGATSSQIEKIRQEAIAYNK